MENITPKTCKISFGTTLEELAKYFDLSIAQLKWYHNLHCPSEDRIEQEIAQHTQIIFVPPIDKDVREIIFRSFSEHSSKNSLDSPASAKDYGVVQTVFVNGEEQVKMHYEIKVTQQKSQVVITRKSVYINDQKPDTIIEQLADEIGRILYPLEMMIDEKGTLISILNQQQILDKWLKLKPKLQQYYQGDEAENLLENVQNRIRSKSRLLQDIQSELFFQMYFLPLEKQDKALERIFDFGELGRFSMNISLFQDEKPSDIGKIIVRAKGELLNHHLSQLTGSLDFMYKINPQNHRIFSIFGEVKIHTQKQQKIFKLECYELLKNHSL